MAVFAPHSEEKRRVQAFMIERLKGGERVVIGTHEPMHIGAPIDRSQAGEFLVVKRRATREEFIAECPADKPNDVSLSAPFYWELEVSE